MGSPRTSFDYADLDILQKVRIFRMKIFRKCTGNSLNFIMIPASMGMGDVAYPTSSRKAFFPFIRITGGVKNSINGHPAFRILVKNRIWKSPDQYSSCICRLNRHL
jgi:hypothetical protein